MKGHTNILKQMDMHAYKLKRIHTQIKHTYIRTFKQRIRATSKPERNLLLRPAILSVSASRFGLRTDSHR